MVEREVPIPDALESEYNRYFGSSVERDLYKCRECGSILEIPHHEDDFPTTTYCGDHGAMEYVRTIKR